MFKMPLVSFIVTSYNYERYILKTLESEIGSTEEVPEVDDSIEAAEGDVDDLGDTTETAAEGEAEAGWSKMHRLRSLRHPLSFR